MHGLQSKKILRIHDREKCKPITFILGQTEQNNSNHCNRQIFSWFNLIKIEVKDNNVEQALRVLKRKLQRDGFFKIIKLKNTYEKPSEKKKRILQENIKRVKK